MTVAYNTAVGLSVLAFGLYGLLVLFADGMVEEFERFGLSRFRRLTGALEVLGAAGLLGGLLVPPVTLVASGGLAILMALGVATRIRVRDTVVETLPAVVLLLINAWIFRVALGRM